MAKKRWIPEIMYEEDSKIPFIMVPDGESNPIVLFVFISRETGDTEPGLEGEEVPIVEMDLHSYADMQVLKDNLDEQTYDKVRSALGLDPLKVASAAGEKITQNARDNVSKNQKNST